MPSRSASANDPHTQPRSPPPEPHPQTHLLPPTDTSARFPWPLSESWTKSITARSRRRRLCAPASVSASAAVGVAAHASTTAADVGPAPVVTPASRPAFSMLRSVAQVLTPSLSPTTAAYVALLVLSTTCSLCAASPCQAHSWWDPVKDKCIPCTECQGQLIVLRPCQLHRDTVCGSIYDLEIDWMVLAKTEPNWKERRKSAEHELGFHQALTHEELQQLQLQQHEETIPLDWQTAALFLAVLACLLFFIVAACILVQHMRQWRRMERRLDQDVEELSTKLMAKLAEVQSLEGGTFFIGNADALKGQTTFQPQHVLLPEKHAKHSERRVLRTLQPGNVYIEENGSKG